MDVYDHYQDSIIVYIMTANNSANQSPRLLSKTENYELLCKVKTGELSLILRAFNDAHIPIKQFEGMFRDLQYPQQLSFFISSTSKLHEFLKISTNYSVNQKQGAIKLKIPVSTVQGNTIYQLNLKLKETVLASATMVEAIGELRNKINKIKIAKKQKTKQKSEKPSFTDDNENKKCLRCQTEQKIYEDKSEIYQELKEIIKNIKQEILTEMTGDIIKQLGGVRKEITLEMGEYIEQMKNVMKKELKQEIREQFWETGSANENKGQLLFNMLRTKSEKLIDKEGECKTHSEANPEMNVQQVQQREKTEQKQVDSALLNKNVQETLQKSSNSLNQSQQDYQRELKKGLKIIRDFQNKIVDQQYHSRISFFNQDSSLEHYSEIGLSSESEFDYSPNEESEQSEIDDPWDRCHEKIKRKLFPQKYLKKKEIMEIKRSRIDPFHDFEEQYQQWKNSYSPMKVDHGRESLKKIGEEEIDL